jgi:hypothetical protein
MRLPKKTDLANMTDVQLNRLMTYIVQEQQDRTSLLAQEKHALEELEALGKKYKLDLPALARMVA